MNSVNTAFVAGAHVVKGIQLGDGAVIADGTTAYKDAWEGMLARQQASMVLEEIEG